MFFTTDDLIHIEEALGLRPTPQTIARILTKVLYFRAMLSFFGPWHLPFAAVNLLLHIGNTVGLALLLLARGVPRTATLLAATIFGGCPLLVVVLGQAASITDVAALSMMLLALYCATFSGRSATALAPAATGASLLCKESTLALPLLTFLPFYSARQRARPIVQLGMVAISALFCVTALVMNLAGRVGMAPSYSIDLVHAPLANALTYIAWFVSLHQAMPDAVRTADPNAWRIALPFLAACIYSFWRHTSTRQLMVFGAVWSLCGLLIVLPLTGRVYPNYLYVALPGLAIMAATASHGILVEFGRAIGRRYEKQVVTLLVAGLVAVYGLQAHARVSERLRESLPNVLLPRDPFLRHMYVAGRAVQSLSRVLPPYPLDLVVLVPPELTSTIGTLQGRVTSGKAAYDLQRSVLDDGRALQSFFPQVRTVEYVNRWSAVVAGRYVAVPIDYEFRVFPPTTEGGHALIELLRAHGAARTADVSETALNEYYARPPAR